MMNLPSIEIGKNLKLIFVTLVKIVHTSHLREAIKKNTKLLTLSKPPSDKSKSGIFLTGHGLVCDIEVHICFEACRSI